MKKYFLISLITLFAFRGIAAVQYTYVNHFMNIQGNVIYFADVNNDATADFLFNITGDIFNQIATVTGQGGSEYVKTGGFPKSFAVAEPTGSAPDWYKNSGTLAETGNPRNFGGQRKYLMARVKSGSDFYYGWIDLFTAADGYTLIIYGYAFNNVPNQIVTAGQGDPLEASELLNKENILVNLKPSGISFSNIGLAASYSASIADMFGRIVLFVQSVDNRHYDLVLLPGTYVISLSDNTRQKRYLHRKVVL